ncbi:MAG TPA: valine--tRNA ligase, partial [Tepidisphaeraceae bacterium]
MLSTELSKPYEPATVEPLVYKTWLDEQKFVANPNSPGDPYSIVIPPPNVTGALHLGHAINNTLQDILIRRARMMGKNTLWIPGIDHAGIATQAVVEKQLKEKENKTRHDVGREGLVERIWQWKQQFGDRILMQLQRLGCSCDWSRTHFTLDDQCARAVRETFFKLFRDGLIYRGKRLVNWDIALQTSISDDEIYHETVKTNLWHIKYPIVGRAPSPGIPACGEPGRTGGGGGEGNSRDSTSPGSSGIPGLVESRLPVVNERAQFMTVATTRPETLLGDTAVAVHSEDPRWNWAIGMHVELPLTGRKIPIIADDILVDPKFGSGVVKVTPAHDPNDYAVYQRHLTKPDEIALINILNPDGTLNENAGEKYKGLKRDKARAQIVEDLEAQGLLAKTEPYETQVGHSDRSKTPVEPYLSDQWFVKMAPLAEPALQVVRDGTIKFFPERHAQQYLSWLGEKRDWPISRQLWWGHRIPVWSKRLKMDEGLTGSFELAGLYEAGVDHILDAQQPDSAIVIDAGGTLIGTAKDWRERLKGYRDEIAIYICTTNSLTIADIENYAGFVQDPDVLDTWFSSALWPHSTLGWPDDTADLRKWYPTNVLLTGRDIVTLWVARMVMTGMYNMGNSRDSTSPGIPELVESRLSEDRAKSLGIPFHHVCINPTILDGHGERMSKSKGNGVDPVDIIETHGADALRFTLATMATETQDVRMPVKKMPDGRNTSDKFDFGRNFCNKLWNATRFVLTNLQQHPRLANSRDETSSRLNRDALHPGYCEHLENKYTLADQWIISQFNRSVAEIDTALANYRFDQYAKTVYDFFWRDFCDWYLEAAKLQLKNSATAATTAEVLASLLDGAL